jgi:carboxylesterase
MAQHPWLDPGPFSFDGGDAGVLLVHGLSGAPVEVLPIGERLVEQGYTVVLPCVAGHGTCADDLRATTWQDWYDSVERAYLSLRERCGRVVVGGLSTGALLSLRLCARHREIAGLVCMAPAVEVRAPFLGATRFLQHVLRDWDKREAATNDLQDDDAFSRIWSYEAFPLSSLYQLHLLQREVASRFAEVRQPLLVLQGRRDRVVARRGVRRLLERVSSRPREVVWLDESGHTQTVDKQRHEVAARVAAFVDGCISQVRVAV